MPRWPAQVLLLLLAAVLVLPVFALAGAWFGFDAAAQLAPVLLATRSPRWRCA